MTRTVKTAVSLPRELFERADELAERLGVSRSELYARALGRFVSENLDDAVTRRLDEVYADDGDELDRGLAQMQWMSLPPGEW